jgi:hypothetical protein
LELEVLGSRNFFNLFIAIRLFKHLGSSVVILETKECKYKVKGADLIYKPQIKRYPTVKRLVRTETDNGLLWSSTKNIYEPVKVEKIEKDSRLYSKTVPYRKVYEDLKQRYGFSEGRIEYIIKGKEMDEFLSELNDEKSYDILLNIDVFNFDKKLILE